jgi:hypothetical protein
MLMKVKSRHILGPGFSRRRTVYPYRGRLCGCRANRKKQPVEGGNIVGRSRARRRWHSRQAAAIGVPGIEDIEKTFAATHIDARALGVDEDVIRIPA